MDSDLKDTLAAKAIAVVPGRAYNDYRRKAAERVAQGDGEESMYFEAVLSGEAPARALAEQVIPSFMRYLEAKKIGHEAAHSVVVALFLGAECYLLRGEAVIDVFCTIEGLARDSFRGRVKGWLS